MGVQVRIRGVPESPDPLFTDVILRYQNTNFFSSPHGIFQAQNAPKPSTAKAPPWTPLGELTTLPQAPSRLGKVTCMKCETNLNQRAVLNTVFTFCYHPTESML